MKTSYIKHIGMPLLGLLMLGACTEDNGNYTYNDLGKVTLQITPDTIVMYGEDLTMKPRKDLYEGTSEAEYDWSWEIAPIANGVVPEYREIASTKEMNIPNFQEEIGAYNLRLSAIHRATGVRTMAYCNLKVDNGLSRIFLMLTHQAGGDYDLEAVTYPGGVSRFHQYSYMNGGATISDARQLVYLNSFHRQDERLYILGSQKGQTISPVDLVYQGTTDDIFFEPASSYSISHILMDREGRNEFVVSDGGIHFVDNIETPVKARVRCRLQDGTDYNITGVGEILHAGGRASYAFYDELNGRLLEWNDGYGAKYIQPLTVTSSVINSAFDPQAIDKKLFASITGHESRLWMLFEDKDNALWLYPFKDGGTAYYNVRVTPAAPPVKLDATTAAAFRNATAFCPVRTLTNKFYYAVDNTIWIYNADTGRTEDTPLYTSPDPDMRFSKILYRERATQEVTFAGNSHGQGTFFRVSVDNFGIQAEPTDEDPDPVKIYDGFGEIIDFVYKYKDY